jgi:hypothetical protein
MIQGFTFEHDGRTYTCTVERRTTPPEGLWWWFAVSSDEQRYAPFQASSRDTQALVRRRITEYYKHVLEVRARPIEPRARFSRPGRPPNAAKAQQADATP